MRINADPHGDPSRTVREPSRDELAASAAQYISRGWQLFWLPPGSRRPRKGSRGKDNATSDIEALEATLDEVFGGRANLAGLPPSGTFYLDLDIKDGKDGPTALRDAVAGLSGVPIEFLESPVEWLRNYYPMQRSRSGGWHALLRTSDVSRLRRMPLGAGAGVECGWAPKFYLVLEPSVVGENGALGRYAWEDGIPRPEEVPDAPLWLLAVLQEPEHIEPEPAAKPKTNGDTRDLRVAATALSRLGVDCAQGYDTWVSVLAALKSIEGQSGADVVLDLADDWSKQARDKYGGRHEVQAKLGSFTRGAGEKRVTLGTLVHLGEQARRAGTPGWADMPMRWTRLCMLEGEQHESLLDAMLDDGTWARIYTKDSPAPKHEFVAQPGVVAGALNFFHGPPKSSKSNYLLHFLCELLRGRSPIPGVMEVGGHVLQRVFIVTEMHEAMTHAFLDLYDPDYELRGSGKLLVASSEFKLLLSSAHELQRVLTHVIEQKGIDLVAIDTFTAFSGLGSGDSISEAADTLQVVNALLALPATVLCTHHDRKAGDGSNAHVHMLGSTAIRAASSANTSVRLVHEASTLMRIEVESRDPEYLRWLARRAEAKAQGATPPPPPPVSSRSWWIRLGIDEPGNRVVYRIAEPELVADLAGARRATGRKATRAPVTDAVGAALERLHTLEAERARADERMPVHVFALDKVVGSVRDIWDSDAEPAPGKPTIKQVLSDLEAGGDVLHLAQGEYPLAGRRAGHGLATWIPSNAHPRGRADPQREIAETQSREELP